jgi:hypothetical protein
MASVTQKTKGEGSLSPLPLTIFTAGNVPYGRDAPRSLKNIL